MRRRDVLISALAVAAASRAALAQRPPRVFRVGFLTTMSAPGAAHDPLAAALAELGYQEGRNLVIERRYAAGDLNRLPALAADLVRANADVIVTHTTPAAVAAKHTTAKTPIVMASSGDPVGSGLVASLSHPGGNVTGLSLFHSLIDGKKVEFLRDLKPDIRRVAFVGNSQIVAEQTGFQNVQAAATSIGIDAIFVNAPIPDDFEPAFAKLMEIRADAAIVPPSGPNTEARARIAGIVARYRVPSVYGGREFVAAGGLVSYGPARAHPRPRVAVFVDRILKGANPAHLPVEQPRKFELVINLNTAKALGLTIPRSLLMRADEVIK